MSQLRAQIQRAALQQEQARVLAEALAARAAMRQDFDVEERVNTALSGPERFEGARSVPLDHQRARAIPIIGPMSGGGAIPGTRPGVSRRLGSWSGR